MSEQGGETTTTEFQRKFSTWSMEQQALSRSVILLIDVLGLFDKATSDEIFDMMRRAVDQRIAAREANNAIPSDPASHG